MNGPEHYREAERLLDVYKDAITEVEKMTADGPMASSARLLAATNAHALLTKAHVHAELAKVAATLEAADQGIDAYTTRPLVLRPTKANPDAGDPAFPGSPWGRALYGEVTQ